MKRKLITLSEEHIKKAHDLSLKTIGKSNLSGYYQYLIDREFQIQESILQRKFNIVSFIEKYDKKQYPMLSSRLLTRPPMHIKSLAKSYHLKFPTIEDYINEFVSKGLYEFELCDLYAVIEKKDIASLKQILKLSKL